MKLEFIPNVRNDYPEDSIVRLFDFDEVESDRLRKLVGQFILNGQPLALHKLDFVSWANCRVTLVLGDTDFGLRKISESSFNCELTKESFGVACEIIGHFCKESKHGSYNWLYDNLNPIEFLYSPTGEW